ncbi:MAG: hypothetical protein ACOYD4_04385 [Solirubrobacterales bacterium]
MAAVRDDPGARLALARSTYGGPTGDAPRHLPFRRAAMSFMRWEARRGVLNALDAAPRLALGRLAPAGRPLGDPRLGMAGVFLSMGRVLPDRYPVDDDLAIYLKAENTFGRVLDYAVIQPRLRRLYDWSARELERPEISALVVDGTPAYAWSPGERREWEPPPPSLAARAMRTATAPR